MKIVEKEYELLPQANGKNRWKSLFECYCGKQFSCYRSDVSNGKRKSCGCHKTSHGFASHSNRHPLYATWSCQKQRCTNQNYHSFDNYGGRGIIFSSKFNDFTIWLEYVSSLENYGKENYTIDRIDNDNGYCIGNLRWATKTEQSLNRRNRPSNTNEKYITIYRGKYRVRIITTGLSKSLGSFNSIEEAIKSRDNFLIEEQL